MKFNINVPMKMEIDAEDKQVGVMVGHNQSGKSLYNIIRWMHQHIENIVCVLGQAPLDVDQKLAQLKKFVDFSARTTFIGTVVYTCEDENFSYTLDYNYENTSTYFEIDKDSFEKWAEKAEIKRVLYNTHNIRLLNSIDKFLMLAKTHNVEDLLEGNSEVRGDERFDEFIEKIAPHFFILPEILTLIEMINNINNYNIFARAMKMSEVGQTNTPDNIYAEKPIDFPVLRINWDKAVLEADSPNGQKLASSLSTGIQAIISMILTVGRDFDEEAIESVSKIFAKE